MHPKNQRVTSYHHCDFITRPQGQILINEHQEISGQAES
jgi:hypothetical protein